MTYQLVNTKQEGLTQLAELVEAFERDRRSFHSASYNEASLRNDFLNPLLLSFGWDVYNEKGNTQYLRDVVQEESIEVENETNKKFPDYTLRVHGHRKIFLEAKKPSVDIAGSPGSAFQTRRYGWNANLGISLLSNFEKIVIYDCRYRPIAGDDEHVARIRVFDISEYITAFDEIYDLLSFESDIALGHFNIESDYAIQYNWSQLVRKYLNYSKANKSMKTTKRENNVLDSFGSYLKCDEFLTQITTPVVENYREFRLNNNLSPATVSIELRILKTVFNQGVKWVMLRTNPVNGIRLPKSDIVKIRFLRQEEISRLLKVINDDGNTKFLELVLAYLHTGARRIEILKPLFTWNNVNFNDRKIIIQGLKGTDKRYIPMNKVLYNILVKLKAEGCEYPFEFVPDSVTHKIAKYYVKADIEGANLHSLRKTFGSLLLQNKKADLLTVSRLLGHVSIRTTEKFYVDLLDENYRDSVEGLEEII